MVWVLGFVVYVCVMMGMLVGKKSCVISPVPPITPDWNKGALGVVIHPGPFCCHTGPACA